jgi:hypothetical protein
MNKNHLNIANHVIGVIIGLNLISYYFGANKNFVLVGIFLYVMRIDLNLRFKK